MTRRVLLAAVSSLLLAAAAQADVPGPPHLREVDPVVRFEGIADNPGYVFYLRYLTFRGGPAGVPHRLVAVTDSNPFNLNAERRLYDVQLLALPHDEFTKRAADDPSLQWLTDKTDGVLVANLPAPATAVSVLVWQVPVTTYGVRLRDGYLSAWLVGETLPASVLASWAAGVLACVALGWLGVRIARRRRTAKAGAVA